MKKHKHKHKNNTTETIQKRSVEYTTKELLELGEKLNVLPLAKPICSKQKRTWLKLRSFVLCTGICSIFKITN